MNCPACSNQLKQIQVGGIEVDVCENGCGGLWFDLHELKHVDESHETLGESLLDIKKNPSVKTDGDAERTCPRCEDVIMMKHFMSVKREVVIDECGNCGGVWLDAGELGQIRGQEMSDDERSETAKQYFSETFGEMLDKMAAENAEKSHQAGKISRLFKFLLPSYYIPGKQKWGAF